MGSISLMPILIRLALLAHWSCKSKWITIYYFITIYKFFFPPKANCKQNRHDYLVPRFLSRDVPCGPSSQSPPKLTPNVSTVQAVFLPLNPLTSGISVNHLTANYKCLQQKIARWGDKRWCENTEFHRCMWWHWDRSLWATSLSLHFSSSSLAHGL